MPSVEELDEINKLAYTILGNKRGTAMNRLGVCVIFGPPRGRTKVFSIHRRREDVRPLCKLVKKHFKLRRRRSYEYDVDINRPINATMFPGFELYEHGRLCVGIPPKPIKKEKTRGRLS